MVKINVKNLWKYALFILAVCLLSANIFYPMIARSAPLSSTAADGQTGGQQRTISVTGTADVLVAPDEVDITVGIETRNPDFQKAKAENEENSRKVIQLTKKYGIDPKDVQSDYIRTYPSYDYDKYGATGKVSFYNVQKRIIVKLKDIDRFEVLTSDLMSNGAIMVQNIEFISTELPKYKNEARRLAVKAAKDKAQLLAAGLDSGIARPVTINEEQIDNWSWYGSWWWGSSWYGYNQPNSALSNVSVNLQNSQTGPGGSGIPGQTGETISIGQIKITARIGVVFELD